MNSQFAALIAALRSAGIRINVTEVLRAQVVLERARFDSHAELEASLCCILIKDRAQLAEFRKVFRQLMTETSIVSDPASVSPVNRSPKGRLFRPSLSRISVAMAIGLLAIFVVGRGFYSQSQPSNYVSVPDLSSPVAEANQPIVDPETTETPLSSIDTSTAAFAAFSFITALMILYRLSRRLPDSKDNFAFSSDMPRRILPETPKARHLRQFLQPRDEEIMVWRVGRYIAPETTRQLNLPATVVATAVAGGRVDLRLLEARHQRIVWLWIDVSASATPYSTTMERFANELATVLKQSGVFVEILHYQALPVRLSDTRGDIFTYSELEARRDSSSVVIFTDGRALVNKLKDTQYCQEARTRLRKLGDWPQLLWIDFGRGKYELSEYLMPLGFSVVIPEEAATWLGCEMHGETITAAHALEDQGIRLWAGACSIAPYPLDEESVLGLRKQLDRSIGLMPSPWALESLRIIDGSNAGRLCFNQEVRSSYLSELVDSLPDTPKPIVNRLEGTVIEVALRYFLGQVQESQRRLQRADLAGSLAALRLQLDEALLRLWCEPEVAALLLSSLHGGLDGKGPLALEVERALGAYAPMECDVEGTLPLPWELRELESQTQTLLVRMGLGAEAFLTPLMRNERLICVFIDYWRFNVEFLGNYMRVNGFRAIVVGARAEYLPSGPSAAEQRIWLPASEVADGIELLESLLSGHGLTIDWLEDENENENEHVSPRSPLNTMIFVGVFLASPLIGILALLLFLFRARHSRFRRS